jgi:thioredoxin-related protein
MRRLFFLLSFLISSSAFSLEFSLPQMNGSLGHWNSAEHHGVYVMEFFFNNCPYCHQNEPFIKKLAEDLKDEPVHVLDIGRDCRDSDYRSWTARHNPEHPVLKDCSQGLIRQFNVRSYPTTIVVGCDGEVIHRQSGAMSSSGYQKLSSLVFQAAQACEHLTNPTNPGQCECPCSHCQEGCCGGECGCEECQCEKEKCPNCP